VQRKQHVAKLWTVNLSFQQVRVETCELDDTECE